MLVGSLSSSFYVSARLTQDADFVVQMETGKLSALMTQLGSSFRLNPQTSFELATATRRFIIKLIDNSSLIELFLLSDDPHDIERFSRRRKVRFLNREAFLPKVEDAIITKLRWFSVGQRQKDLQDARGMIALQADRIDWAYVNSWCDRHGTRELLDRVRQSVQRD